MPALDPVDESNHDMDIINCDNNISLQTSKDNCNITTQVNSGATSHIAAPMPIHEAQQEELEVHSNTIQVNNLSPIKFLEPATPTHNFLRTSSQLSQMWLRNNNIFMNDQRHLGSEINLNDSTLITSSANFNNALFNPKLNSSQDRMLIEDSVDLNVTENRHNHLDASARLDPSTLQPSIIHEVLQRIVQLQSTTDKLSTTNESINDTLKHLKSDNKQDEKCNDDFLTLPPNNINDILRSLHEFKGFIESKPSVVQLIKGIDSIIDGVQSICQSSTTSTNNDQSTPVLNDDILDAINSKFTNQFLSNLSNGLISHHHDICSKINDLCRPILTQAFEDSASLLYVNNQRNLNDLVASFTNELCNQFLECNTNNIIRCLKHNFNVGLKKTFKPTMDHIFSLIHEKNLQNRDNFLNHTKNIKCQTEMSMTGIAKAYSKLIERSTNLITCQLVDSEVQTDVLDYDNVICPNCKDMSFARNSVLSSSYMVENSLENPANSPTIQIHETYSEEDEQYQYTSPVLNLPKTFPDSECKTAEQLKEEVLSFSHQQVEPLKTFGLYVSKNSDRNKLSLRFGNQHSLFMEYETFLGLDEYQIKMCVRAATVENFMTAIDFYGSHMFHQIKSKLEPKVANQITKGRLIPIQLIPLCNQRRNCSIPEGVPISVYYNQHVKFMVDRGTNTIVNDLTAQPGLNQICMDSLTGTHNICYATKAKFLPFNLIFGESDHNMVPVILFLTN